MEQTDPIQATPNETLQNHTENALPLEPFNTIYCLDWFYSQGLHIRHFFFDYGLFIHPVFTVSRDTFFTDSQKKAILETMLANMPTIQALTFSIHQLLRVLEAVFSRETMPILFAEFLPVLEYNEVHSLPEKDFFAEDLHNDLFLFGVGPNRSAEFSWAVLAQNHIPHDSRVTEIKISVQEYLGKTASEKTVVGYLCLVPDNSTVYIHRLRLFDKTFILTYRQLAKRIFAVAQLEKFKDQRWVLEDVVRWIEDKAP